MNQQRFQYLLDQYIVGEISPENRQELAVLMELPEYQPLLQELLTESFRHQPLQPMADSSHVEQLLQKRLAIRSLNARTLYKRPVIWWSAAACIVLAASLWLWLPRETAVPSVTAVSDIIPPGSEKAILRLADGRQIILDQQGNGLLSETRGIKVWKLDSGSMSYQANATNGASAREWNSLTTPKGGQFQITLPDGTKVWLNAATTLSFPTAFTEKQRQVKLSGEAYFEVKQDTRKPFLVNTGETNIQVLGTSFNIMAYREEGLTATTLVSGSVAVSDSLNRDRMLLQPAQQAVLETGKSRFQLRKPDMEQVMAWKNGYFSFEQTDLKTIMRQIGRWYNVTVEYAGNTDNINFTGRVSKKEYATQLLELLEMEGRVHFELKGSHIIVKPGRRK